MNNLTKRILLGMTLGTIFGLMCFAGFVRNTEVPEIFTAYQVWAWNNPMMWGTIFNRFMIGFTVAIAGFITIHPFLGFRTKAWIRGFKFGSLFGLMMSIGMLMNPEMASDWKTFWMLIGVSAIIGMIIDLIITRVAGEGSDLMIEKNKKVAKKPVKKAVKKTTKKVTKKTKK